MSRGLPRDNFGTWICGFTFNTGYCTSIRAELFATLMGLEIAWSMGIKKLILESDSTITVNALTQDRDKIDANHAFIVIGFTCLFLYFKNVLKK